MLLNVVWFLIVTIFDRSSARNGFIKDQNEDLVQFPPKLQPSFDSNIPIGWQNLPEGIIAEEKGMLSYEKFFKKYVSKQKPVVFRNGITEAPALVKWSKKNYLKEKFSHIDVNVTVKKSKSDNIPKTMKFGKFLKDYLYDNLYMSNYVPQEMMADLVLPSCLNCAFEDWLMECELWMSSGGTSSLLHSHADHDVHCMISGRKDFILIEQNYKHVFKFIEKEHYHGAGYSDIDMDQINMFKDREIGNVPWRWSTLRPGDCIFVPAGYLHQVRSYGKSSSYTNHFAPTPSLNFAHCKENYNKEYPLNEKHFLWSYINGKLLLANDNLDAKTVAKILLMIIRNQTTLTKGLFESFYDDVMAQATNYPPVNEVWSLLTSSYQADVQSISRVYISKIPNETLNKLALIFNMSRRQMWPAKKDEL
ncbi:hypothetical protein HELRODRAFT_165856 [Helobdella robusta]|uniref:JmjC domain-containing protein n=1 Tax=Helobdella robusta TaxID=6412 RepID=T1EXD2_HELRO|nr:hypothetical protein HELRODRAFT_165856 [Helobdella robusta]ESN91780.1 hypothetical protein HELRODRAFT_165856 [Helobdella robusta]